jgi:hypothetical protein
MPDITSPSTPASSALFAWIRVSATPCRRRDGLYARFGENIQDLQIFLVQEHQVGPKRLVCQRFHILDKFFCRTGVAETQGQHSVGARLGYGRYKLRAV